MQRLLTQQEAAAFLNVDVRFLLRRVRDKHEEHRIKASKFGRGKYRFHMSDLEDYVNRQGVRTKSNRGRKKNKSPAELAHELAVQDLQSMGFTVGGPESYTD